MQAKCDVTWLCRFCIIVNKTNFTNDGEVDNVTDVMNIKTIFLINNIILYHLISMSAIT